jgi:uncharacterized protein
MRVVIDTNVLVSGLLNGTGNPGKIIDLILENRLQVVYDDRILGEYEDVLARPELHIHPQQSKAIITYIELAGKYVEVEPYPAEGFPDQDDLPFVEVFISGDAQVLVTGNVRHFKPLLEQGKAVYTPAQFVERFFFGKE